MVNSCIEDLEIKAHTLKGNMFMHFLRENVFEACLSVKQLRHTLNIYWSYLPLINAQYCIFRHPFSKHLASPYFWSDSNENLYANSNKRVEIVWYEVSWGYAALIEIYNLLKVVPFFQPPGICIFVTTGSVPYITLSLLTKQRPKDSVHFLCYTRPRPDPTKIQYCMYVWVEKVEIIRLNKPTIHYL